MPIMTDNKSRSSIPHKHNSICKYPNMMKKEQKMNNIIIIIMHML